MLAMLIEFLPFWIICSGSEGSASIDPDTAPAAPSPSFQVWNPGFLFALLLEDLTLTWLADALCAY